MPDEQPSATKPSVYYDGSCPMCSREIAVYQRMRGADGIAFVDVSACTGAVAPDLTKEAALARFHVRDGSGKLVSGALAFATLWRALPTLRMAGKLAALPGIRHGLEVAYIAFLPVRPWLQRRFQKSAKG